MRMKKRLHEEIYGDSRSEVDFNRTLTIREPFFFASLIGFATNLRRFTFEFHKVSSKVHQPSVRECITRDDQGFIPIRTMPTVENRHKSAVFDFS